MLILLIFGTNPPEKVRNTEELMQAMHRKYAGKWVRTLTFTQHNTHYAGDTVQHTSTWYEAIQYPDKFRIDVGDPAEGNAILFASDSVFRFQAGKLTTQQPRVNELLLLTGGMYFRSVPDVQQRLRAAKYDLSKFREATWQGRPVYIVGAAAGDVQSSQFWIDQEHLYLVRTFSPTPDGHVQEARFSRHIRTAGGWTEAEVLFLTNGEKRQLEEYKDVRTNPQLPPALFRATEFEKTHWRNAGK